MTNAAAQNLAQHVAAAFIRRHHAIVDEERRRACMVGDDAQAGVAHQLRQRFPCIRNVGQFRSALDQRRKQIRLKVADLVLQHGGHALETHARINRWLGQRRELVAVAFVAGSTTAERSNCMKTRFQIST